MGDREGRSFGVRKRGWATVGDAPSGYGRGDGSPHPRGQRGVGRLIFHVFTGAGSLRENGCGWGWIPAFAGMTKGGAVFWRMTGGSRTAPTEENVVGHGVHPHPNLPPSRGKGLVGAERAISIVMTCFTKGDGFPPSREKREVGGATVGDAPSKYGGGSPHARGHGGGARRRGSPLPRRGRCTCGRGNGFGLGVGKRRRERLRRISREIPSVWLQVRKLFQLELDSVRLARR